MSYSDPLDLFRAAVDSLNREKWRALAELCDRASLEEFKTDLLDILSPPPAESPKLTATELIKAVPGMPRAVAEYQVQRFREQLDPDRRLRDELPSVSSRAEVEKMKPLDVFTAWLEGRSLQRQVERTFERKQMSRAMANEILASGARRFDYVALGYVDDGETTRYVVYRRNAGDTRPRTAMIRRQPDGAWLLVADRDFLMISHAQLMQVPEEDEE